MSEGTITATITTPIILGQGVYGNNLFVTTSAAIEPLASGANAITGPSDIGSASLVNYGVLRGANAGQSNNGAGGDGVLLQAIADVINDGSISGGTAGSGAAGGVGVNLSAGGTLQNSGTITGGSGGIGSGANEGGAGVEFHSSGTLANTGDIVAGHNADAAVVCYAASHVTNAGLIDGLIAAAGVELRDGGDLANTGTIYGGLGFANNVAANGRAGLKVDSTARIFNGGDIAGGYGSSLADATAGSGPGASGGIGILLQGSGSICDNAGTVTGSGGGGNGAFNPSGNGGVGAVVDTGNLFVNSGETSGGVGAGGGVGLGAGAPGAGGAGAVVLGGELFNLGTITGGAGGLPGSHQGSNGWTLNQQGGAGGVGVIVSSGRLVAAAGTISGGAAGAGYPDPSTGLAVAFGNRLPATLVVDPGAVFIGGIEASPSVADTLMLGGTAPGTLDAFGEAGGIRNFQDMSESAGSHWSLSGSFTSIETLSIGSNAFLALDGPVSGSAIGFAQSGGDTLSLETPATFSGVLSALASGDTIQLAGLDATSFTYANNTITLLDSTGATQSTLTFAGTYTTNNFHLEATNGATQIDFIPTTH